MASVQDKAASEETALEEDCQKISFQKGKAVGWILTLRVRDGNHDSLSRPNRWGQIIIKAAEPESWYCVFQELQGEDTDSPRPSSPQESRGARWKCICKQRMISI